MSEFKHFNCFLFCCEKNVGLWDLQIIRLFLIHILLSVPTVSSAKVMMVMILTCCKKRTSQIWDKLSMSCVFFS